MCYTTVTAQRTSAETRVTLDFLFIHIVVDAVDEPVALATAVREGGTTERARTGRHPFVERRALARCVGFGMRFCACRLLSRHRKGRGRTTHTSDRSREGSILMFLPLWYTTYLGAILLTNEPIYIGARCERRHARGRMSSRATRMPEIYPQCVQAVLALDPTAAF